jgi:hypothetical protein
VSSILFYLFFLSVEQVIEDKLKKPTVKNMFDDDDEYEGGINIQVAKQRMMEEDKFDKQFNVKTCHFILWWRKTISMEEKQIPYVSH